MQALSSLLGENLILTISLALIVTGCVVIIISFLGCCGSIKEVKCMLMGVSMIGQRYYNNPYYYRERFVLGKTYNSGLFLCPLFLEMKSRTLVSYVSY